MNRCGRFAGCSLRRRHHLSIDQHWPRDRLCPVRLQQDYDDGFVAAAVVVNAAPRRWGANCCNYLHAIVVRLRLLAMESGVEEGAALLLSLLLWLKQLAV